MDKISTQKFNVNVKNSDMSIADNVLGALFSMPMIADEKKVNDLTNNNSPFGEEWSMVGIGIRYPISNSMAFELGQSNYSVDPSEIYSRAYIGLNFLF